MKNREKIFLILVTILFIAINPFTVQANSAKPPSLVILVNNPPKDLKLSIKSSDGLIESRFQQTAWEGYYLFHSLGLQNDEKYIIQVSTKGETFECSIEGELADYHSIATLDLSSRTLTLGTHPLRDILLIFLRLFFTLILEGLVFFVFGYRQKRSWLVFLIINLITQGILNYCLSTDVRLINSYLIFGLIFGEILVFIGEMIAFPVLLKEKGKLKAVIYAFVANFISLFAGAIMLSYLPV